jgi:hypothetical protein
MPMNELLNDWYDLCEKRKEIDKSHFLALFKSGLSDTELASVFKYFPFAQEMSDRLKRLFKAGHLGEYIYLQPGTVGSQSEVGLAAEAWIREQARFCNAIGEKKLGEIAETVGVKFIQEAEFDELQMVSSPQLELSDNIRHSIWWNLPDEPTAIFALIEALYGVAADYYLAWYVMQPMLKIDLDFDIYLEFWRQGGAGVLTEDAYCVRSP